MIHFLQLLAERAHLMRELTKHQVRYAPLAIVNGWVKLTGDGMYGELRLTDAGREELSERERQAANGGSTADTWPCRSEDQP